MPNVIINKYIGACFLHYNMYCNTYIYLLNLGHEGIRPTQTTYWNHWEYRDVSRSRGRWVDVGMTHTLKLEIQFYQNEFFIKVLYNDSI